MSRLSLTTMIMVGAISLVRSAGGFFKSKHHAPKLRAGDSIELTNEEREHGIKVTDKGVQFLVDPKELVRGVPARDAIPSIDNLKFIFVKEANARLRDTDLVMGIDYKGEQRAYPLRIMAWHEIVNDNIAGDPILITYCPLCSSGIAYERRIDGEEVQFGISGKLYNSNLVTYDRKTGTLWSQFDGLAIIGELTGKELTLAPNPLVTTYWRDWKKAHPNSMVLSKDTGF